MYVWKGPMNPQAYITTLAVQSGLWPEQIKVGRAGMIKYPPATDAFQCARDARLANNGPKVLV